MGPPSAIRVVSLALGGQGGGMGPPSAIRVVRLVLGGQGGGMGPPSAIRVVRLALGSQGGGIAPPSAKMALPELHLFVGVAGSRIKTARERSTQTIASFFTD